MPYIKAPSGIEWYFDLDGQGDTLLFIHGWGVDRRIWRQQTKYFSHSFKVMAIDLPGHGESSWIKVSFEVMAGDLKFILESQDIRQWTVVASSVGGLLALRLYDVFTQGIKKISFCGTLAKFSKSDDYPFGLDVDEIRKFATNLKIAYPSMVNIFFRSLFTQEERETRRFKWIQKFRRAEIMPLRDALLEYLDILEVEDLREAIRKVKVPLQFINGTDDEICDLSSVEHLKTLVPQARFDFFKKCGHFPFLSKPYEFNAVLEEFLKS